MKNALLTLLAAFLIAGCKTKPSADFILYNGKIYTADSAFTIAEAMAVKDGKILATGNYPEIDDAYVTQEKINLQGKAVFPGFIDAHCHFYHYGTYLRQVDLTGTKSFNEVLQRIVDFRKSNPDLEWISGRGWDQNDWEVKEFPDKKQLDSLFPSTPVFIQRIDGHAALANSEALKRAGVNEKSTVNGGLIQIRNGALTGILLDNAMPLIEKAIPQLTVAERIEALQNAERNCFEVGLTTVDDAGLDREIIELIDSLQNAGKLSMRVYAMIAEKKENLDYYLVRKPYKTERLNVRSVKFYGDGALGSRGACLLKPYADANTTGFLLSDPDYFRKNAAALLQSGYQMNAHCIGDSANRLMLDVYSSVLKGKNDLRWRIEHAQVVSDADLEKFAAYSIIPSVQPTHATSDMYWAEERLGRDRINTAYRYAEFVSKCGMIAAGSDFPVEHINPLYGFYAAVTRKDQKGFPEQGFQAQNKLSRKQALLATTRWAAFSNFEEHEKGTLETGKFADFVVLEEDIMEIAEPSIPKVKVLFTYLNGKKVYQRN